MRTNKLVQMTALTVLGLAGSVHADTFVTTGAGGDWRDTASWTQNNGAATRYPASGDSVTINDDIDITHADSATTVVINAAALTVQNAGTLTLSGTTPSLSLNNGGSVFDVVSGGVFDVTASGATISNTHLGAECKVFSSANMNISGSGSVAVSGRITIAGTLTIDSGTTLNLSATNAAVSVDGEVDVNGTLTLSGSNSGVTVNSGGVVELFSGGAASITSGSASFSVNSAGDFDIDSGATATLSGTNPALSIVGRIDVDGTFELSGTNPLVTLTNGALLYLTNGSQLNFSGSGSDMTVNNGGEFEMVSGAAASITAATTFTIVSGGDFDIDNGASVFMSGSGPSLTVSGILDLAGHLQLDSSSATAPYVRIQTSQTIPLSGGDIQGVFATSELQIDSGVTVTNDGTVHGDVEIMGSSGTVGTFVNDGLVHADADELKLDFLSAVNGSGTWTLERFATLTFNKGSTNLTGPINLLGSASGSNPHGGQLNINDSVATSGTLTANYESVSIAATMQLCVGAKTGSCTAFTSLGAWSGAGPFCLPAGTYNQCP